MAHFNLENEVSNALRYDAPLSKGPVPRWQRKKMELSMSNLSINVSCNESNMSLNKSLKPPGSPKKVLGKQLSLGYIFE